MAKREKIVIEKAVAINDEIILTEGDEITVVRNSEEEVTKKAPKAESSKRDRSATVKERLARMKKTSEKTAIE